jgi:hypothetical protein
MRGRRIAWLAVLAATTLAGPAAAQPAGDEIEMDPEPKDEGEPAPPPEATAPVKDPKLAKKWLVAGQQLLQKGDLATRGKRADDAKASYENAATAFSKSIEAGDDLNAYALLAETEEKLGKIELAVKHYRVVVKAQAGLRSDVLKKATARLAELATKIGVITLTVKPDGAAITFAGAELGKAPLAEPLILLPGTYTIALQADGYQPRVAEINVEAGSETERSLELEEVKIIVQPPVYAPPPPPPPPPSRIPLYAGAGAAATLLGVSVVTGILAISRHGTYVSRDATAAERDDAKASGESLALVADLALVGALAAGGFTAYWYFIKYKPAQQKQTEQRPAAASLHAADPSERAPDPRRLARGWRDGAQWTKVDLIPWVQSGASGLTLVGAF